MTTMMMIRDGCRTAVAASSVALMMLMTGGAVASTGENDSPHGLQSGDIPAPVIATDSISTALPVGPYQIVTTEDGDEILVEDFGYLLVPGKPKLPSKIFAIAIPPGARLVDVRFDAGEGVPLPGTYKISPVPLPRVIGQEDPAVYEKEKRLYQENFDSVYGSNDAYPQNVAELVRPAGYRKYNLLDVRTTPFTYRPLSGQLTFHPQVTVHIDYSVPAGRGDVMVDSLARTERIAKDIIINYDHAASWYPRDPIKSRGLHDFVIITLDSLTSSVAPLATWETYKGRTVEVVTTSWIDSNYTGYDLAEQMRNFLRDKYPSGEWGIEDVLLVGHYDDVPMRRTWQDVGYGKPETDLYYAELSLPDHQSWDDDQDHKYGENTDPIDFYSEVNVGRIPWSEPDTVLSICEKSVAYEESFDPAFKKNILLLGAYFWEDTDNAELMEAKVDQPWMSDWTMTRMYEQNIPYWSSYPCDYPLSHGNVMSVWPAGQYAFVNWAGHGSPYSCHILGGVGAPAFIETSDCPSLNDDYPAIVFADACSNSDTDHLNIGQAMLKQGAVGFLGATKVAYGRGGWDSPYDGSSQSFDYFFTTCVTSGDYTQGEAHQWALREMYTHGLWYYVKYEMFEWGALWGNPDLGIKWAAWDCNDNGILDACDIDCGVPGGECDVPGCGQGEDCNWDGILDECQPDFCPPTPNPMTWEIPPTPVSASEVTMTAVEATEVVSPPVDYRFTSPAGGGHYRAWGSRVYNDTGLSANAVVTYQCQARDSADPPNEGGWSWPTESTATHIETPTDVDAIAIGNDYIEVEAAGSFTNLYEGNSGIVFRWWLAISNPDVDPPLGESEVPCGTTTTASGLAPGTEYTFRAWGRNQYGIETPDYAEHNYTTTGGAVCGTIPGDIDGDWDIDGDDIGGFVRAKLGQNPMGDENQACANYGGTLEEDIASFVADLLGS